MLTSSTFKSSRSAIGATFWAIALLVVMGGVVATALLSARYGWSFYLDLLSHFQMQYAVLLWLLWGGLWLSRHKGIILVGLFFCAVLTVPLLSWYVPPRVLGADSTADLRVFVANLNVQNHRYADVIAQIQEEQPDVVVVMEVDQPWVDQLNTMGDRFPYAYGKPNPYNLGLMVYSRYPFQNPSIQEFGTDKNVSVVTDFTIQRQTVSLVATHPLPPLRASYFHARNRQLDLAGQYIQALNHPAIAVGDFNTTPWSPYFKRFQRQTRLWDARKGFGILPTWTPIPYGNVPRLLAPLFALPIDHCLVSPNLRIINLRTGADTGSDHRPLIVDIDIPNA